jgi:uncharacterized protein
MKIDLQRLSDGVNEFKFEPDIRSFRYDDIHGDVRKVVVESTVYKADDSTSVNSHVEAIVDFECDKCLSLFTSIVQEDFVIYYTSDKETADNDDEDVVRYLSSTAREIDLTEGLHTNLRLAFPMRIVCIEACKGLCSQCGCNLNAEACDCKHDNIDPRWEGLKKLLNQGSDSGRN